MQMHQLDARIDRLLKELKALTVRESVPVTGIRAEARGSLLFTPFENGGAWGADAEWMNFSFSVTVPERFSGRVVLKVRTGREDEWEATNPQFLARVNGRIEQAFDTKHTELLLPTAVPYSAFDIVLNGYAQKAEPGRALPVLEVSLQDVDENLLQLTYDLDVPYQAVMLLPPGGRDREATLETLARALDLLDLRAPHSEAFHASVVAARRYMAEEYYKKREKLPQVAVAEAVGHTHIDVAWLWDLYQTRHKAVRSFSTVLKLMEQYPEYKFMSSQAALYNMVKQDEPELFERIKGAVRAGRWEVEGGMWVEADCNLAGGESLVRQFLVGQRFFEKEFGIRSRILWLPDVFGYSAALPQILKLAGIDYFMTTKLSWSEFNLSPYDTFRWKGIDGSEVLTHFSPSRDAVQSDHERHDALKHFTTYNAMLAPNQIAGGWQRFQQKGLDDHYLVSYGYGDGGGGPTDWMLENSRRMKTPMPGLPSVQLSHARPFFEALEERVGSDPRLPKWSGELYLEYHRGTYTAMARNKRANRKIELLMRDVELLSAMAQTAHGLPYPQAALSRIWEDILTLQFHDILPGSSIREVYDDSLRMYEKGFAELTALRDTALEALSGGVAADVLAYNTLSHMRDDIVWFDAPERVTALRDADGNLYPVQHVRDKACAYVRGMRPMGATALYFSEERVNEEPFDLRDSGIDTPFYTVTFDDSMRIVSLFDKAAGREVVRPGEALNRIICYENKPHNYDAWDINIYYDRRHFEVDHLDGDAELVSIGPVLLRLRATYRYMDSTIAQEITFYRDIGRIDFDTEADWREVQYLLKAHFPVDVFYNEATYDIQYGNIRRATHKNTSWDVARFEVCAHKWADVSEAGFGVSLLNDCKYGYSIDERGMALTLLKSSKEPNPVADQEIHRFTYSLMPHGGDFREGGTVRMGYQLNVPVLAVKGAGGGEAPEAFAGVDQQGVIIKAVKQAEDGDGIIIRMYECFGRRVRAELALGFDVKSAELCNLLEERTGAAEVRGRRIALEMRPYQIVSMRVRVLEPV